MEQESKKKLIEESGRGEPARNDPILCASNCGFFGNAATNNLCSKCYKDYLIKQSRGASVVEVKASDKDHQALANQLAGEADEAESSGNNSRLVNRCSFCRKKVGLTGFKCRCEQTFCSIHRYSDKHNCVFDYKSAGQDAIAKANPIVKADKIDKI